MNRSPLNLSDAYRVINPGLVVLISVGDGAADNVFTVAWNMPVRKDPPMLGLVSGKRHYSWSFIERTGELAVNVLDAGLARTVLRAGKTSGRDLPDKFADLGITRQRAARIRAPLVAEAVACLECRVSQIVDLGASALVIAQVLAATAATDHFADGHWRFDSGLRLLHHLSGNRFCVSDALLEVEGS